MTDYLKKALAEWSWADIELLIEREAEEGPNLELKQEFSTKDSVDPWQGQQKKISDQAKKSIGRS